MIFTINYVQPTPPVKNIIIFVSQWFYECMIKYRIGEKIQIKESKIK